MRALLRVSALISPLLFLAGCDEMDFGSSDRFKEDFHFTYALPSGGRLSVENSNGAIDVTPWEKDTIEINGTKHASSQQTLKEIKVDVQASPASVAIRTVMPVGWRNAGARYSIRVPKRVQLERIVSSNGPIRIEGIEGNARLKTSNGSVRATHTKGELDIQTSNGSVEIDNEGNARVRSSNGSLRIELAKGFLEANTSNGGINARLRDPDSNAPVRIESSNGHVDLTMNTVREVRMNTSNSGIVLRIPGASNARLRAHTSNSSISTDFDVLVRGGVQSKHTLEGNIGGGGPLLDLATSNGSIKVLKM